MPKSKDKLYCKHAAISLDAEDNSRGPTSNRIGSDYVRGTTREHGGAETETGGMLRHVCFNKDNSCRYVSICILASF